MIALEAQGIRQGIVLAARADRKRPLVERVRKVARALGCSNDQALRLVATNTAAPFDWLDELMRGAPGR